MASNPFYLGAENLVSQPAQSSSLVPSDGQPHTLYADSTGTLQLMADTGQFAGPDGLAVTLSTDSSGNVVVTDVSGTSVTLGLADSLVINQQVRSNGTGYAFYAPSGNIYSLYHELKANGSLGYPSLYFNLSANSGLWHDSTNSSLSLQYAGNDSLRVTASGITLPATTNKVLVTNGSGAVSGSSLTGGQLLSATSSSAAAWTSGGAANDVLQYVGSSATPTWTSAPTVAATNFSLTNYGANAFATTGASTCSVTWSGTGQLDGKTSGNFSVTCYFTRVGPMVTVYIPEVLKTISVDSILTFGITCPTGYVPSATSYTYGAAVTGGTAYIAVWSAFSSFGLTINYFTAVTPFSAATLWPTAASSGWQPAVFSYMS